MNASSTFSAPSLVNTSASFSVNSAKAFCSTVDGWASSSAIFA
ncbi:MAG: hypothetical protein AAGE96_23885 [Cyanobacteria bacterium P01_G01_bin.19]